MDKVLKNLETMGQNLEACARTACWQVGAKIMYKAKKNAHERFTGTPSFDPEPNTPTGRLAGSITTKANFTDKTVGLKTPAQAGDEINKPSGDKDHPLVATGTNVEYAEHPEFGTKKMHARPYLYPAFFECENDLPATIKDVVEKKAALRNFNQRLPIFDAGGAWE